MTDNFIFFSFLFALGFNLLLFLPASILKTDKLTDISYAASFLMLAGIGFWWSDQTTMQKFAAGMIAVWALRLGGYLLIRILKQGKDRRFNGIRENPVTFLRFWVLQGLSVFVVMLPSSLLWQYPKTPPSLFSCVGLAVFLIGLILETAADWQKLHFNNHRVKNIWIDEGVWKLSRHPNYLGEMLVWIGIFLFIVPALSGIQILIAVLSPLYITTLLYFVSGIPILEKSANKRWGKEPTYIRYKKEVPVLIPALRSLKRFLAD